MSNISITPSHLVAARGSAQISQAALAKATGISRTEISRFENGWLVLPDAKAAVLQQFVEQHLDAEIGTTESAAGAQDAQLNPVDPSVERDLPGQRIVDGVVVAPAIDDDEVEALASQLQECMAELDEVLPETPEVGFLVEDSRISRSKKLLARCGLILRRLHGIDVAHLECSIGGRIDRSLPYGGSIQAPLAEEGERRVSSRRLRFVSQSS